MGICGLLGLLKSIQTTKHLSDFAGQTLAVDAYVWLHRGIHTCATELATGKSTKKYVDYAMQRIRLLRHHKVQPYVVFDGGPLPAKRSTERDRKQRREENLARAKALTAEGKHSQAREFYAKCVDVTPQMAFQFIKALRAEGIQYIVAPYEADAQMAYLERIGLVDGIITEDSDLLVFGCRNVLFKFDFASSTVAYISRTDFGSVSAAEGGISLAGWTDTQFRAMAILSGCDYLPSIPGVGLKTAWSLLRKHRSVAQVVRALRLEGKKPVPKGYIEAFGLAEKVFLHQRVYCPLEEKLVNLTDIPVEEGYDAEVEAYVGRDLESCLAKLIAVGEVDPVTHQAMQDIYPAFAPRCLKPLQFTDGSRRRPSTEAKEATCASGTLLSFFSSKPALTLRRTNSVPTGRATSTAGKNSGKRSLAEILDEELAAKRMKRGSCSGDRGSRRCPQPAAVPGSKRRRLSASNNCLPSQACGQINSPAHAKENIDPRTPMEGELDERPDPVNQEDGYMSPTESYFRSATPDLSSPVRHPREGSRHNRRAVDDFGADIISSPAAKRRLGSDVLTESLLSAPANLLVRRTPSPTPSNGIAGPDLRDVLSIATTRKAECFRSPIKASSSGPTPAEDGAYPSVDELSEGEGFDMEGHMRESRVETVRNGWWNKWAWKTEPSTVTKLPKLRRCETTVTFTGRQSGCPMPRTGNSPSNLCDGGRTTRDTLKQFQQKFSERASKLNPT